MSSSQKSKYCDHSSIIQKGLPFIKKYVKLDKNNIFLLDADKQTLLHVAAFDGDEEIVAWLLKHVKPNDLKIRDKNGWIPMHAAARLGKLEMYELFLKKGSSPNAQNADLTSPFAYLCRFVKKLIKKIIKIDTKNLKMKKKTKNYFIY